ncbi:adenosylcobinamide-GDP ribazoletransferase [Oceanimonas baumannii]|uniref:Adenosylcobinamide-GDP ribazoletransferase n=1 Tax=Oceanimonas baumannii TaxID=129578 RepID=A0A235CLC7_9GAMM|nr:adenosylcobinamide-GDP ribazoletransferase [Oceanimonas baumannii]OYD25174.1 adenosylcobinamide-GDP ribazoletransferase [Oceanimonas baumannii]TDW62537.1 cobalamin-5'-phosphate synthase [Oceanimonas baumannii]
MKHELTLLLVATQFLTRLPLPALKHFNPDWLHQSSRHFPAVGLLVGALCALIYWLADLALGVVPAAVLSTAFGIYITGAFHEDGLADTCDGLGGGLTKARALTIMKDSRLGTFGTLGLVLALLLKIALLASMIPVAAMAALMLAHSGSRLACISLITLLPYGGDIEHAKAKPMAQRLTPFQWGMASLWLLPPLWLLGPVFDSVQIVLAVLLAALATAYMYRLLKRRLNGYTGDGLGATQQLAEIAIYAGLAAQL